MKAFLLLLLGIPPHSYEEDWRNDANSDLADITRCIWEKQKHQRNTQFKADVAKCSATMTVPALNAWLQKLSWFSGSALPRGLIGSELHQELDKMGIPNGRTYTRAKPAAGCFSREFCGGKAFTCILWSLGGGKCHGNIAVGWGGDGDCPPELYDISVQECYGRNFHVLGIFDSLALSQERDLWEE